MKPPVAILVPTYNGGRFLAETLRSVEEQSYANLRVLVRDDGSSDDSVAIAREFAARDNRFTVIPGGDRGGAENNCIQLTQLAGEPFVKLLMQDDPLHRRHVEKLVTPMIKNPDITFASAARQRIDVEGNALPDVDFNKPLVDGQATLDGRDTARHVLLATLNQIGEPSTAIVRNGCFDPEHPFGYAGRDYLAMSDVAMWLTLLGKGPMFYTGEVLSSFRQHESQRSQDMHVHIQCVLEWAHLFEGAVRTQLLDADANAKNAAAAVVEWNQQLVTAVVRADTREYDHHLPDMLGAIGSLWATMSAALGSAAPVAASLPAA